MADPQVDPALAPLPPLSTEVSPPPLALGYANPLLGVATEFFKLHQADQRRQANRELDRREQLAQQFDQFANDPRYANHPDIQREAHFHAAAIRQIPYNKNLPTQYKPNADGQIPAYGALFHRAAQAEIRKNGEPSKPPEPAAPPPVANPFGGAAPQPAIATGPPAPSSAPVPGGVQPVPGKISPAPVIGTAPPAPPAPPADNSGGVYQWETSNAPGGRELIYYPPGMTPNAALRLPGSPESASAPPPASPAPPAPPAPPASPDINAAPPPPSMPDTVTQAAPQTAPDLPGSTQEIYPMTPPEMAAFNNSMRAKDIPEIARAQGIDPDDNPDALVDLRTSKFNGMLSKAKDREVKMRIAGLDPETGEQLPPEQQTPIAHYRNAQADLAEARVDLVHAQTISEPIKRDAAIAAAKAHIAIAQQNADTAVKRLGIAQGTLDLNRQIMLGGSTTNPGTGGSGGPLDVNSISDAGLRQTMSGAQWVDSRQYFGKAGQAKMNAYRQQGLTVLSKSDAEKMDELDAVRMNQQSILDSILDKLPKDATGHITQGLTNKLQQFFQSDEELASYGSWRQTAVQSLQGLVRGGGFRMNQAEILMSIANDIPKVTDTVAVAQRKIAHIRAQYDNLEKSMIISKHIGMRGSSGANDYRGSAIQTPPPNPGATNATSSPAVTHRFNAATGKIEAIQ